MIELTNGTVPAEFYDEAYFEGGKGAYQGQELVDDGGSESKAADWLINRFKIEKDAKVLDLGCSKGFRVYLLARRGIDSYGIDCSRYATAFWTLYKDGNRCLQITVERETQKPVHSKVIDGLDVFAVEEPDGSFRVVPMGETENKDVVLCKDYVIMNGRLTLGDVTSLPYKDQQFYLVAGFDLLEHLSEEQIENCIKEAIRVSKNHIFFHFCIGNDEVPESDASHVSVHPMDWWYKKFEQLVPKEFNFQAGPGGSTGWVWIWKDLNIDIGGGSYQRYEVNK